MFSCCVIGYKHLLIQLWIIRVTAEGLYQVLCTDSAVAFQLETHQSLCSPLLSRSSQGACHLSYGAHTQSHTPCTQRVQYMNRENTETHPRKEGDLGTSMQWHKHSHKRNAPTRTHFFLPLSSFILVTAT